MLLADVEGLSGLLERLQPPEVAALLGDFHRSMSEAVFEQQGTLDKFVGDAVMAVFGAPTYFPDVPTLWELGYGFSNETIHAIVGPARLPPEVKRKLEEGYRKGMETTEFKSAQVNLYLSPVDYDSKAYEKHLKERWVGVEKIMMEAGIITEAATQPE